jgi:hypothetical protein
MTDSNDRLDRIEALVESNAKAIQAFGDQTHQAIQSLTQQTLEMQRQMLNMQRQMIDSQRRIDDNSADIRELVLENQRILKYLETIVNRSQ